MEHMLLVSKSLQRSQVSVVEAKQHARHGVALGVSENRFKQTSNVNNTHKTCSCASSMMITTPAVMRPRPPVGVVARASKGFGDGQPKKEADVAVEGAARKVKNQRFKGKQSMRTGPGRASQQQQQQQQQTAAAPSAAESPIETLEFETRLKELKAASAERRAEVQAVAASRGGILDGPQYDNPPPLSQTLFGGGGDKLSAAETDASKLGASQVGLGAAALALVAVFLVTSIDAGPSARRPSAAAAPPEMGAELRADLEGQLATVEAKLGADPKDLESLEASAVLHFRLGDYATAARKLSVLTAARPGDAEAWRVLAEARGAGGDVPGASAAYRRAWEAGGRGSLEVLTGLSAALAADGKEKAAVDELRALAADPEVSGRLGELELGLLLGKAYSQWRGHSGDAVAQYDALAAAHPDDFRPPLAKGLLLRREGREGDAQRYLLQARYLAPAPSKAAVDALAEQK
jgi:Flp pilus assembly protein TadD